jgi:ABC-2 type transport system permease protein
MQSIEGFQFIVSLFVFPLLFLSSPFSTLESLPPWLRNIAFVDPITYGIDGLRATLIGYSHFPIYISFAVLIVLSSLMILLGSYFFSKSEA